MLFRRIHTALNRRPTYRPALEVLEDRRMLNAGALDLTFNGTGMVTTNISAPVSSDTGTAVATQPDGKVVVAGFSRLSNVTRDDVALVRYNNDGSLDTSFGVGGKVVTNTAGNNIDRASDVAIQPDGKIVVVGTSVNNVLAIRYNSDGSLDTTFGTGGLFTLDVSGTGSIDTVSSVVLLDDGKILIAGNTTVGMPNFEDFLLVQLTSSGSLDTAFGTGGVVTTDLGSTFNLNLVQSQDFGNGVVVLNSGKIVLAGTLLFPDEFSTPTTDMVVVRYDSDGSIDTSFGTGGLSRIDFSTPETGRVASGASGIAVARGNRVVVVGGAENVLAGTGNDFAVVQLKSNGSLDQTFGVGGKVLTDLGNFDLDAATGVVVDEDKNIVVAGNTGSFGVRDFALVRYDKHGNLDTGFGTGGITITDFGGDDPCRSIALQNDGKIVLAGASSGDFAAARYEGDAASAAKVFSDYDWLIAALDAAEEDNNNGLWW